MTAEKPFDLIIVGAGLAGGLTALALKARRPELRVLLVEAGKTAGGNHLWSCFPGDVAPQDRWLIEPLIVHGWGGHEVCFPDHRRVLEQGYASLTSDRLDTHLRQTLGNDALLFERDVRGVTPSSVTLDNGTVLHAHGVIDARGPGDMSALDLGWQKFLGLGWQCDAPHGLSRPIIMDATVDQSEGYRFVYVLPLSARELFIEDTYYRTGPELDEAALQDRITAYAAAQGWTGSLSGHRETGVLGVCMGGDVDRLWRAEAPGVAKIGTRGGFFHALTGYSLPDAVRIALAITAMNDLSGPALHDQLQSLARSHWRGQAYYRMLSTLLFRAAEPAERWRVLARFYRLDPALIGRFYAGQSTFFDKLRILTGKPPVPVGRAIQALGAARS